MDINHSISSPCALMAINCRGFDNNVNQIFGWIIWQCNHQAQSPNRPLSDCRVRLTMCLFRRRVGKEDKGGRRKREEEHVMLNLFVDKKELLVMKIGIASWMTSQK